ncbi:hypothetical protein PHMEG_0007581 [Phytophthora megakarya]|uniref:Uncharacterized protein n=1 Tax=Phytophthora megakarya TaxID=4795 RepID=A0A225WKU1_9STRA|nr:hypothetical protein PHMEG_0007581 [Phytophthora megakarya]
MKVLLRAVFVEGIYSMLDSSIESPCKLHVSKEMKQIVDAKLSGDSTVLFSLICEIVKDSVFRGPEPTHEQLLETLGVQCDPVTTSVPHADSTHNTVATRYSVSVLEFLILPDDFPLLFTIVLYSVVVKTLLGVSNLVSEF